MKHKKLLLAAAAVGMAVAVFLVRPTRPQQGFRPDAAVQSAIDSITTDFRKIIVLVDGADSLDDGIRQRSIAAGRVLFFEKQRTLSDLAAKLAGQYRQSARTRFSSGGDGVRQLIQYL